jgi:hypothetical protein
MITKELLTKWLEALRSGKYTQARQLLRGGDSFCPSFCCLGVLCDIIDPKGWKKYYNANWYIDSFEDSDGTYQELENMLGGELLARLMTLNDIHKLPFTKIADEIEKHYTSPEV